MESDEQQTGNIYSPSELNHEARIHLEAGFGRVWVEGEISNLSRPASGHMYFSLKDATAQISLNPKTACWCGLAGELACMKRGATIS